MFLRLGIVLFVLCLSACNDDNQYITTSENLKKGCDTSLKMNNINEFNLRFFFECNQSEKAFDLINKFDSILDSQDQIIIAKVLLDYDYEKEAIEYFEKSASNSEAEAYYNLGVIFTFSSKSKDISKAISMHSKAIDLGRFASYADLADIYFFEKNVKDSKLAEKFAFKGVEYGILRANYILGEIRLENKNFKEALLYFNKCIENNLFLEGYNGMLNLYYKYPESDYYNIEKAKFYLEEMLKKVSDEEFQKYLSAGDFYSSKHKYRDLKKAEYYYNLANHYNVYNLKME